MELNTDAGQIIFRKETKQKDLEDFKELLMSSGFFYEFEVEAAEDFLKYQLEDGDESGIHYFMAEDSTVSGGKLVGFICFGFDSCTLNTHLLYWMAVHNDYRGKGVGTELLKRFEEYVIAKGAKKIVLETAGRDLYKPTRDFYEKHGYREEGIVPDYYSVGDARVTYVKDVG